MMVAGNSYLRIPKEEFVGLVRALSVGTGLSVLALGLIGCDSGGPVEDPSDGKTSIATTDLTGSSQFDRELIAAKSETTDPALQEQAIVAVLDKYDVAHPPSAVGVPHGAALRAAAVSAAAIAASFSPVRRDFLAGNDIHTCRGAISVGTTQFLSIAAIGSSANVDPSAARI
jgi:hypothetical protein